MANAAEKLREQSVAIALDQKQLDQDLVEDKGAFVVEALTGNFLQLPVCEHMLDRGEILGRAQQI